MIQSPFAIMPWQVALDSRLGKRHLKVLISLLSYRRQDTGVFWATREQIKARCGLPATRISATTTELEVFGWIVKHGGGRNPVRYEFTVPQTVTKTVTVTNSVTVTDLDSNSYRNGNPTVTETVTLLKPSESLLKDKNGQQAGRFMDWWVKYPKKVKKKESKRVWQAKKLDAQADDLILDIQDRLKDDDRWKRGFIPDPPTYLRGERWNDELYQGVQK